MGKLENHSLPVATNESWRAWLMTGARRNPIDKRRLRGSNRGLKKILLEGLANGGGESQKTWTDFSGAMVRHAVDDAMRSLPATDHRVVKMAFFGGYSNREIAAVVGLTEGTVQRRLRRALAAISEYIQHGRRIGRRALYLLTVWLSGRWLGDAIQHVAPGVVVAAAAVIIVAQPSPPGQTGGHDARTVPVAPATRTNVVPPVPSPTAPVVVVPPGAGLGGSVAVPTLPIATPPVHLPKVETPDVPPLPRTVARVKNLL